MRRLLVQWRKQAGLNQAVFAARLGITQSEVSKYERGERRLSESRLGPWLAALEVPGHAVAEALERQPERSGGAAE